MKQCYGSGEGKMVKDPLNQGLVRIQMQLYVGDMTKKDQKAIKSLWPLTTTCSSVMGGRQPNCSSGMPEILLGCKRKAGWFVPQTEHKVLNSPKHCAQQEQEANWQTGLQQGASERDFKEEEKSQLSVQNKLILIAG